MRKNGRLTYTRTQIADIVEENGLEEAINDLVVAEAIEDSALSRAWAKARAALREIEELLSQRSSD